MDRRWWGLLSLSLAVAMVIVDVTVINVAIPTIINDLDVDAGTTQWIQTSYTLTLAALLLAAGRAGDRLGRRRVLVVGIGVFMVGSVVAALAGSGVVLVAGRFVQGLGGAAILPATLSLINAEFRGRDRATAFAVWGSTVGGIAAVGPLLGGWLTTEFSWRWAFWINLLLGALAIAGASRFIRESRDLSGARGIDPLGLVLGALAPAGLVFALVEGRTQGWWRPADGQAWDLAGFSVVPAVLMLSLLAAAGFVAWEQRRARTGAVAHVDLALFRAPTFAWGNLVVIVVALGQIGLLFVLPLWLQTVLGYTATRTGLLLIPLALGAFLAAGSTPVLAGRWGVAWVLRFGLVAEIAALIVLAVTLDPSSDAWGLVPILTVYGFGIGTAEAQLPSVLLADVAIEDGGQAAGIQSTAQELGAALGIALLGTLLLSISGSDLSDRLAEQGVPAAQADAIAATVTSSAGAVIATLEDPEVAAAARQAFTHGTTIAALAGGGALVIGLVGTAAFSRRGYDDEIDDATAIAER